jgi:effector-binding domain-containing protein
MSTIPAGKRVSCLHIGPYNEIPKIYQEMDKWLEFHDFETNGISYETYYNGEGFTPQEYLTKIELPIQEADES